MSGQGSGALAVNVLEFARLLRRAGLPVGPADMLAAVQALEYTGVASRADVRTGLRATMVHRHDQAEVFDSAFDLFWRDPAADAFEAMLWPCSGDKAPRQDPRPTPGSRRVAEAFNDRKDRREADDARELDAVLTVSDTERLQTMDFEAMSAAEITAARRRSASCACRSTCAAPGATRPATHGSHIDMAATLRNGLRHGGELTELRLRRAHRAPAAAGRALRHFRIDGSLRTDILLHFLHAVANDRDRVSVFLFGTRLTNITRQLRHKDPEAAFAAVAAHWCRTGRAAPASATPSRSSTANGPSACWARARWCCW